MSRGGLILLALTLLAGCGAPDAPGDVGVCWRVVRAANGHVTFSQVAANVDDLDTCAVLLEGLRLQGQRDANGAYQGFFIFVDGRAISSAQSMHGFRYPIFQPPQRAAIDRDLTALIRQHGGQMPSAAEIDLEHH
jgi:hypothetical protein